MTKLEDIEKSVSSLSPDEMATFRKWFDALDAQQWDAQIEADAKAGKLDALAKAAFDDHKAGRTTKL